MKIYTKTGDKGKTGLLSGERVRKYSPRVEAYGTLDELNSWIGHVRALNGDTEVEAALAELQPVIHALCSDVAAPVGKTPDDVNVPRIDEAKTGWLESEIDRMSADLPELTHFILPGGSPPGSALHIARTVCRRAERRLAELNDSEGGLNPDAYRFVNRLSDYLFTLARWANKRAGKEEETWGGS
jgi:cob(I)alamin adenosyltransferase